MISVNNVNETQMFALPKRFFMHLDTVFWETIEGEWVRLDNFLQCIFKYQAKQ